MCYGLMTPMLSFVAIIPKSKNNSASHQKNTTPEVTHDGLEKGPWSIWRINEQFQISANIGTNPSIFCGKAEAKEELE